MADAAANNYNSGSVGRRYAPAVFPSSTIARSV
jgi:hypothetical protein